MPFLLKGELAGRVEIDVLPRLAAGRDVDVVEREHVRLDAADLGRPGRRDRRRPASLPPATASLGLSERNNSRLPHGGNSNAASTPLWSPLLRRERIGPDLAGLRVPLLDAAGRRRDRAGRGRVDARIDQEQQLAVVQAAPMMEQDALVARRAADRETVLRPAQQQSRHVGRVDLPAARAAWPAPRRDPKVWPSTSAGGGPQESTLPPAAANASSSSIVRGVERFRHRRQHERVVLPLSDDQLRLRPRPSRGGAMMSSQPMSYSAWAFSSAVVNAWKRRRPWPRPARGPGVGLVHPGGGGRLEHQDGLTCWPARGPAKAA